MSSRAWRWVALAGLTATLLFAGLSLGLGPTAPAASTAPAGAPLAAARPVADERPLDGMADERARWPAADEDAPPLPAPHWLVRFFSPRPGEDLLAYRDRVLPAVQAAIAPQRARVLAAREAFAAAGELEPRQLAELDAAVDQAADQIVERVLDGIGSGQLAPGRLKPSTGVAFARDVLDAVDGANRRFRAGLREDQRAALDDSAFDVADYLLFSVPWEQRFGLAE